MSHPCLGCGACCATYLVAFHWSEADPATGGATPPELTERLDPHRVAMRDTRARAPRCVGLAGTVGRDAHCGVYAQRPSPCRALAPSLEDGTRRSDQCDRARLRHGLAPLTVADWQAWETTQMSVA